MAFPTGWKYRVPIVIDHTKIDTDLTNWTFVFDQDFSSVLSQNHGPLDANGNCPSLNGGGDVRFSSDKYGATRLACDIRDWTTDNVAADGTCEVAVKIPSVYSASDTTIYMWWGKTGETQPSASDTYGQYNAYDSYYLLVSPDGGGSDRTSNANDGTGHNGVSFGDATGKIGKATTYDGISQYAHAPDLTEYNISDEMTISTVSKVPSVSDNVGYVVSHYDYPNNDRAWSLMCRTYGTAPYDYRWGYLISDNGESNSSHAKNTVTTYAANDVQDGNWWNFGYCFNEGTISHYENGQLQLYYQNIWNPSITSIHNCTGPIMYGATGNTTSQGGFLNVVTDEIRWSKICRSAAWMKADYNNQFNVSGFSTFGQIMNVGPKSTTSFIIFGV